MKAKTRNKITITSSIIITALSLLADTPESCTTDGGEGLQCCAGQTATIFNECVEKTCDGGNRNDENPCTSGTSYDSCNETVIPVNITVSQYPQKMQLGTLVCDTRLSRRQTLPNETAYCKVQEKVGSCD